MTQPAQPVFLIPEEPGRLSNWSTGIPPNNIQFTVQYVNPGEPSVGAGQMRATARRVASNGFAGKSALAPVWDSGWVGFPTVSLYPNLNGVNSFGMAYWNGRIYITGGSNATDGVFNTVWSAPFNGGSVGSWRAETPLPPYCRMHCCVAINGFLHVISGQQTLLPRYASTAADPSPRCWVAPILGDGGLGGWQLQRLDMPAARCYAHAIQAGTYNNPADASWGLPILMVSGGADTNGAGTAQAQTYATTVNADGSFQGWVTETSLVAARYGHFSLYDDPSGKMWVFGGSSGSAALNTVETTTWNTATRTMGTWANNGTLPGVRAGMAGAYLQGWETASKNGRVVLFGGATTANLPATGGDLDSIVYGAVPGSGSISWNTSARTLPSPVNCLGAAAVLESTAGGWSVGRWEIALAGGRLVSGASSNTVVTFDAVPPLAATDFFNGNTGVGAALSPAGMGTGGSLTTESSGAQNWTFSYGFSTGQAPVVASLADGDEIEVSVQFLDNSQGDPSPITYTSFKVGPAPYISAASPSGSISTGQPPASFTFSNPSLFAPLKQATWRLQVTGPSYPSLVLLNGASMYLRLDGTTTQYDSADTHTGTITGGITTGVPGGLAMDSDTAITFDGSTGYLTCASLGNWANGSWSLEFLVKASATASLPCYWSGNNSTLGQMVGVYVADSSTNNAVRLVANNISVISYGTAASIADGKWHHVAITHTSGLDFRLYLDGTLVSTSTNTQDWNLTSTTLGARLDASSVAHDFANGSMDEAALYIGTVLTPGIVQAHYSAITNGPPVYFDSGIRPDLTNSVLVNTAPLLQSGTNYAFKWTVTTNLDPIDSRSSTSATYTTTVTPSYTIPVPPT